MAALAPDARRTAVDTAESVRIAVDGAPLGPEWIGVLLDVHVRDDLLLPDMAAVRFRDPDGSRLDGGPLKLAAALEIRLGADRDHAPETVFEGEIVALEPEFGEDSATIAVRALDKGHRLNRRRESHTHRNVTISDVVRTVAQRNGLTADVDATSVVHDFIQQSQETDWELCTRLARTHGFDFSVRDGRLAFRARAAAAVAATLEWQSTLYSFRPRASVVGQVLQVTVNSHDPVAGQPTTHTAASAELTADSRVAGDRDAALRRLGTSDAVVADRVATTSAEATALAKAALDRNASAFVEAEGVALGSPKLRSGATVRIDRVGDFSGTYVLSATTHVYKGGGQYTTRLEIAGGRSRAIADLVAGGTGAGARAGAGHGNRSAWSSGLVIAQVTNVNDPSGLGRVKLRFDALGPDMESDWARVATLNAGRDRGVFMLPQVGDEVVVGFEHGDARRAFVLGSLWAGSDTPGQDLVPTEGADGGQPRFAVRTPHQVDVAATKEITLHSDKQLTIEVAGNPGDLVASADGNLDAKVQRAVKVEAQSTVTIKGTGSVTIESSSSLAVKAPNVEINGSGTVQVKGGMVNIG